MFALTLEFGPEGSVRGFQADKIGRAFQAEATGCVGAGAGRSIVSEKHTRGRGQLGGAGPGGVSLSGQGIWLLSYKQKRIIHEIEGV